MADVRIGERRDVALLDERLLLDEEIVACVVVAHEQFVLVAVDQHAVEGRGQIALQGQMAMIGEILAQDGELHDGLLRL